ncbi:MAG: non-canonical purine NTP pyrophosphatase [Candidatus Spyradocola sp.]
MKTIIFATANPGKLRQAQDTIRIAHIECRAIDFDEPRSDDLHIIARAKLRQARRILEAPCFVLDSGFYIDALHGFPGSYVNYALSTVGIPGLLRLMQGQQNRRCAFRQCLGYYDGAQEHYFTSENTGTLATASRGADSARQWSALWHIFIPEGAEKTLSEFTQEQLDARSRSVGNTLTQLAAHLEAEE